MIALLAAFALLVQALVATPVMAMAKGQPLKSHDGEAVAICTDHGLQTITPAHDGGGAPASRDDGGACGHCVCPPLVTLASPLLDGPVLRVAYAAERSQGSEDALPPPARGPPRPYGQGPPAPNA